MASPQPGEAAAQGDVEYLRRLYASTREWYAAAERKAQRHAYRRFRRKMISGP
jgi:hypothetical protein